MITTQNKTLTPAVERQMKNVELVYNYLQQHNKEGILYYLENATQIDISLCSGLSVYTTAGNKKGCKCVSMLNTHLVKTDDIPLIRYSSFDNEPQIVFKENHNARCTINLYNVSNFIVLSCDNVSISFCFDYKVNNTTYKYLFSVLCW